ncbi:N/A [soil metagenome]
MEASLARSILIDAPMGVIAVDGAGLIYSANATAERFPLVADPPFSIEILLPPFKLTDFEDDDALAEFNAQGWAGGGGRHFEALRGDGTTVSVDIQAARFAANGHDYFTLFVQDFTAVIAAQDAVDDLRRELLFRWRLNSMGEMGAMIAHELNQPLVAIIAFLHTALEALERGEHTEARDDVRAAAGQAIRAGETLKQMRSLLSRDTGHQSPTDPCDMMDELMPLIRMAAREVGAEVKLDMTRGALIQCERVQIQQVLMNLARNALEAVSKRRVRRVVISGYMAEGGRYEFRIDDTGPGISPDIAEKIFAPMTSTKPEGLGVGLSICRTIVEAHGGLISFGRGRLGGSGFVFSLMLAPGKAAR